MTHHQHDHAIQANGVQEDLYGRLAHWRSDSGIVILDQGEQARDEEPVQTREWPLLSYQAVLGSKQATIARRRTTTVQERLSKFHECDIEEKKH